MIRIAIHYLPPLKTTISSIERGTSPLYFWWEIRTFEMRMILYQLTFNPDGTPQMFNNTSYTINLLNLATHINHTIKQLLIHSPFKYLVSESTPLSTTMHKFSTISKHATRGTRIISNSKINRYHISLYLKTHLHPKLISPFNPPNRTVPSRITTLEQFIIYGI